MDQLACELAPPGPGCVPMGSLGLLRSKSSVIPCTTPTVREGQSADRVCDVGSGRVEAPGAARPSLWSPNASRACRRAGLLRPTGAPQHVVVSVLWQWHGREGCVRTLSQLRRRSGSCVRCSACACTCGIGPLARLIIVPLADQCMDSYEPVFRLLVRQGGPTSPSTRWHRTRMIS